MEETWRWMLDESGSNEKKDGGEAEERMEGKEKREGERERWGRYCQICPSLTKLTCLSDLW